MKRYYYCDGQNRREVFMYKNPLVGHQIAWYLHSPPLFTLTIFQSKKKKSD